jgi:hypothetical protein
VLGSHEESEHIGEEDDVYDIADFPDQESRSSILGGTFSTTLRGLRSKKARAKRSWIYKHGFIIKRDGELHWKCATLGCKGL